MRKKRKDAKAKAFLVNGKNRYEILRYNRASGELQLRGDSVFTTTVAKATKYGYHIERIEDAPAHAD